MGACYTILEEELRVHACIRIHLGKTKVWNQAGLRPPVCDVLERLARIEDPTATVWKGPGLPEEDQGIKVLGSPLGSGRPVCVVTSPPLCVCSRQLLVESGPSFNCSEFRRDSRSCGVAVSGEHSENRFVRVFRGRSECRHFAVCIGWAWSSRRPRVSVVLLIGPVGQIASP